MYYECLADRLRARQELSTDGDINSGNVLAALDNLSKKLDERVNSISNKLETTGYTLLDGRNLSHEP